MDKPELLNPTAGQRFYPWHKLKAVGDWFYLEDATVAVANSVRTSAKQQGLKVSAKRAKGGGYLVEVLEVL